MVLTTQELMTKLVHQLSVRQPQHDLLAYYYVSAFANTKPDLTHPIQYNFTRCEYSFMS